jgi:hypothetical protein
VYQHPVPAEAVIPEPHFVDLTWDGCPQCGHAWQPDFDAARLSDIYRSHYYTPAPSGIGALFREEFIATLDGLGVGASRNVLLEIGAADGELLEALRERMGAVHAYAFEPNIENAAVARRRGLDVREKFFGHDAVAERLEPVQFICARHVIEHVFDFESFFAGLNAVAAPEADLLLETPSLDHHALRGTIDPFHIEHVHVFALRSLAWLARMHGWGLRGSLVTASGNLIAAFSRSSSGSEVTAPPLQGLQRALDERRGHLRRLLGQRRMIFWGAGSAGIVLASLLECEPEIWTDGNPNKVGRRFVGSRTAIVSPECAFELAARSSGEMILVVTSSFVAEILPRISEYGWRGEVYDTSGNRLDRLQRATLQ